MKLIKELTVTCTNLEVKCNSLEDKVLNLSSVVADQNKLIINLQKQIKNFKKSRSSTSLKRLKKVGTSQIFSSPDLSTHLEEDASKQGRNEDVMDSGEAHLKRVNSAQDMNDGMVSGEVPEIRDMDVESPQDAENFVVADQSGKEVVMEKVISTQEKVVEKLKTLEPEQLMKATGLMGEALMKLGDLVENKIVDSAATQATTADSTADAQDSAIGSGDNAAAEAMVLLSKKTTEVPSESSSKHTPLPTPSLPQQTTTITISTKKTTKRNSYQRTCCSTKEDYFFIFY
jgi:uncharacterized coiled-coil protein SlyX